MKPLLNKGYYLCTENWYTSFPLLNHLLVEKTTLTGTLRKNKKEIPKIFLTTDNRVMGSALYGYQKSLTLLSYVPDKKKLKNVLLLLLSSLHTGRQNSGNLTQIIQDFNWMKTGVDVLDQLLG